MARKSQCSCVVTPRLKSFLTPIERITADPANLRKHPETSIAAIMASYKRFGQQKPIVVDEQGVTVAGAGQLEAARRLGWTHIAVVRSDLAGVERIAYAIADNRSAELSDWDEEALARTLGAMLPRTSRRPASREMISASWQDQSSPAARTKVFLRFLGRRPPDRANCGSSASTGSWSVTPQTPSTCSASWMVAGRGSS
jgi:hypothetical protein